MKWVIDDPLTAAIAYVCILLAVALAAVMIYGTVMQ